MTDVTRPREREVGCPDGCMTSLNHALVVGGTGMLRDACLTLAERARDAVTVVARDARKLRALQAAAAQEGRLISPRPADYHDDARLRDVLREAQAANGPFDLALCWIHSTAPRAHRLIAHAIHVGGAPCRYFHVLGSATRDPSVPGLDRHTLFARYPNIRYREIVLGFALQEDRMARWLTDGEITDGVLRAVAADVPRHVVGTVRPWDARP